MGGSGSGEGTKRSHFTVLYMENTLSSVLFKSFTSSQRSVSLADNVAIYIYKRVWFTNLYRLINFFDFDNKYIKFPIYYIIVFYNHIIDEKTIERHRAVMKYVRGDTFACQLNHAKSF